MSAALVFVVDDHADVRAVLADSLRLAGYAVAEATHGQEVLDLLRAGATPALIILELAAPVMTGFELLRLLKVDAQLAAIPVIVLSGDFLHNDFLKDGSVARYFRKPADAAALLLAVQQIVAKTSMPTPG